MRTHSIIAHFPGFGGAVLGLTLATTSLLATPVHAAPRKAKAAASAGGPDAAKKKEARDAYGAGEKAYAAGDYTTAYDDFKKAHDLIPTIHAEYWMAMSQSQGTDIPTAYDALAAVVASPDASKLGDEKLAAATARLAEVKKIPATVAVTSLPSGAELSVDGAAQPGTTPQTLSLTAGSHRLGVALAGYEAYATDLTLKPGQKLNQQVELKASAPPPAAAAAVAPPPPPAETAPAPPAAPPPAPEAHSKVPAYITLGVGVVGAGVGTIFGISALSAKSDFNKNPTNSGADKAERDALIADMGWAVAITLGVTGIVLLTTSDSSSEVSAQNGLVHQHVRARLDFAPVVTARVQGAAARLTF